MNIYLFLQKEKNDYYFYCDLTKHYIFILQNALKYMIYDIFFQCPGSW